MKTANCDRPKPANYPTVYHVFENLTRAEVVKSYNSTGLVEIDFHLISQSGGSRVMGCQECNTGREISMQVHWLVVINIESQSFQAFMVFFHQLGLVASANKDVGQLKTVAVLPLHFGCVRAILDGNLDFKSGDESSEDVDLIFRRHLLDQTAFKCAQHEMGRLVEFTIVVQGLRFASKRKVKHHGMV